MINLYDGILVTSLIISEVVISLSVIMLIRNNKVYKFRSYVNHLIDIKLTSSKEILDLWERTHYEYEKLPSYNQMVLKFWVPLDKFKTKELIQIEKEYALIKEDN